MKDNSFKKYFGKNAKELEELCQILRLDKTILEKFEESYAKGSIDNVSILGKRHQHGEKKNRDIDDLKRRIVQELVAQTQIWTYDHNKFNVTEMKQLSNSQYVTKEEINALDKKDRPLLTGNLMKVDVNFNSGITLLNSLKESLHNSDLNKRKQYYHMFRQGLDLVDLDPIVYMLLGQNQDAMGYWLPKLVTSIDNEGFFKVPKTTIIKVPITLLQLTRIGYEQINQASFDIVNEYCKEVFKLDENKKYFIKTGTYSSKFDFRNACIKDGEVNSLGEYLLFIHSQALSMAHFDVKGNGKKVIYGASTTNEWVIREFIEDIENNLTIYHGLPLRTEYRVFVDFDDKKILGIHSYWDKDKMVNSFNETIQNASLFLEKLNAQDGSKIPGYDDEVARAYQALNDSKHDLITFLGNYDDLNNRFLTNKDMVCKHLEKVIQTCDLSGQWSIDIMQNGNDFYMIDMQGAKNSVYFKETVPDELRKDNPETWVPQSEENTNSIVLKRVKDK